MNRPTNNRRKGSKSQEEKDSAELQALRALVELLTKDRIEKQVTEATQQIEAKLEQYLELATATRKLAENIGASTLIAEIDAYMQRVEDEAKKLLEKFVDLKSPSEEPLDTNFVTDKSTGVSKEMEALIREKETFFAQKQNEISGIHGTTLHYVLDQRKQDIQNSVDEIIGFLSKVNRPQDLSRTDEQGIKDIDTFKEYLNKTQEELLEEIDKLNLLVDKPEVEIARKFSEVRKNLSNLRGFQERTKKELKHFSEVIQTRGKRRIVLYNTIVVLINTSIYLQWTISERMILPQQNGLLAFAVTGLILITGTTFLVRFILHLYEKYAPLINIAKSRVINHLFAYIVINMLGLFLLLALFIISLRYLSLFLYFLFNFLTETNPFLTLLANIASIAAIIGLLFALLNQFGLIKFIKKLISVEK